MIKVNKKEGYAEVLSGGRNILDTVDDIEDAILELNEAIRDLEALADNIYEDASSSRESYARWEDER